SADFGMDDSPTAELLSHLSPTQLRYVSYKLQNDSLTQEAAANLLGIATSTITHWPPVVSQTLVALEADRVQAAQQVALSLARAALVKATEVRIKALDDPDPQVRLRAADALTWMLLGKPATKADSAEQPALKMYG